MKNKIVVCILFVWFSNSIFSQTKENVNPKGNWFFGAEIGTNKINSFEIEPSKTSFQIGFISEYYFARHWSLSGRIKYFNTGVSFYKPSTHSGSWLDLGSDESFGSFNGTVIAFPIDIKWEFRIFKNLGGSLKLGSAYTIETYRNYGNYSSNINTNFPQQYGSFNVGWGLNYFINKKVAVYLDVENYSGASKGHSDGLFGGKSYNTQNQLVNFGIKYNFKKNKEGNKGVIEVKKE